MRTSLYVDGFNFYYGCFRMQRHRCVPADKWLDWRSLGSHLIGENDTLHRIHYFTANVHLSHSDPDQNLRQELYFRAIDTIPGLVLHKGKHIRVSRSGELIFPKPSDMNWPIGVRVTVQTFEEKGSDVNLAVQLLDDAWSGDIQRAIVISNDTDLIAAIRSARRHIQVDVVSPQDTLAKQLQKAAAYSWSLDPIILRDCRMSIPKIARDGSELYPPHSWTLETWPDTDKAD